MHLRSLLSLAAKCTSRGTSEHEKSLAMRKELGLEYPLSDNYGQMYSIIPLPDLADIVGIKENELIDLALGKNLTCEITHPLPTVNISFKDMLLQPCIVLFRMVDSPGEISLDRNDQLFWSLDLGIAFNHHRGSSNNRQLLKALIPRNQLSTHIETMTPYGSAMKLFKSPSDMEFYNEQNVRNDLISLTSFRTKFFNDDVRLFDVARKVPNYYGDGYMPFNNERPFFIEEFIEHAIAFYMKNCEDHMRAGGELPSVSKADYVRIQKTLREKNIKRIVSGPQTNRSTGNLQQRSSVFFP